MNTTFIWKDAGFIFLCLFPNAEVIMNLEPMINIRIGVILEQKKGTSLLHYLCESDKNRCILINSINLKVHQTPEEEGIFH